MKSMIRILIVLFPLAFFNTSCEPAMVFDEYIHIDNGSWRWEDPADFAVEINDTSDFHNILVQLRHSTDYPLSNLYMFIHVSGPNGQSMTDTINFILAENSGKWIGKGIGNLREISYLYKKNTMFPEPGEYKVSIEQAMRLPEVPVKEIGLRIEKIKP